MMANTRHRPYLFSASQWQELEHQTLIFKYMMSGMNIPSDLLYPIRRGLDAITFTTPAPQRLFPPHPIGWGCFQLGCGRKPDLEPGRCRRTDGKKWRCSKEAFPDSKYCEKHMNRGRNRSRKPVEMTTAAATNTSDPSSSIPTPTSAKSVAFTSLSSSSSSMAAENHNPFLYPHPMPSRALFSPQNNTAHFNLGAGSYSADRDNRYLYGLKEGVDEHPFFSEATGNLRSLTSSPFDSLWPSTPLQTSSLAQLKRRSCSGIPSSYSQPQMHNNQTNMSKLQQEQQCFVLGTDIKSDKPVKLERKDEQQQPLRRFFDEWPLKSRDSCLDLEDRSNRTSFSSTQLSISIPMASSEFPAAHSRSRNSNSTSD